MGLAVFFDTKFLIFSPDSRVNLLNDMPGAGVNADSEQAQKLLRRFEVPLRQFATRITGDRERARDVVQDKSEFIERAVTDGV